MADYLANLAARSLGQLRSVQPRRASRFELEAAIPESPGLDIEDMEVEPEPVRRAPSPAAEVRRMEGIGTETEREPGPEIAPDSTRERQRTQPESAESGAATEPVSGGDEDVEEVRPVAPVARQPQIVRTPEPAAGPWELEAGSDWPWRDPKRELPASQLSERSNVEEPQRARPEPIQVEQRLVTTEAATPAREEQQAARPEPAPPLQLTTSIAALDREESGTEARRAAAPGPPAITVSIGRVEVKAPQTPEPPRPAVQAGPPQPRISLGEYLERSRRGRR